MANLITLEEYKEAEGIQSVKDDLRTNALIESVSQLVKTYCGNSIVDFSSTAKTEYFTLDWNTDTIQLTESPIIAIDLVRERQNISSDWELLILDRDFILDESTDSLRRISISGFTKYWTKGVKTVEVEYRAGYSECPSDLKLAVFDLVTYYLKDEHKERKTLAGATVQNQASTTQRNNVAFPDHIKRILDLYKNF